MFDRKPKFRSRKLDIARPLCVYRWDAEAVLDLDDSEEATKASMSIATGVEKEEEEETHLQQALVTQLTASDKTLYTIPIPETAQSVIAYEDLYPAISELVSETANYSTNSQKETGVNKLVRIGSTRTLAEEQFALLPRYAVDEFDIEFINEIKSVSSADLADCISCLLYERLVDCWEEVAHRSGEAFVGVESCDRVLDSLSVKVDDSLLERLIVHWRKRRRQMCEKNGSSVGLVPMLRHEDMGKIGADPYVCFRRREIKAPRKTRRSDAQVIDKLRRLHRDLSTIVVLLNGTLKRDEHKADVLELESLLFEKYRMIDSYRRSFSRTPGSTASLPTNLPSFKMATQSLSETRKWQSVPRVDDAPSKIKTTDKVPIIPGAPGLQSKKAIFTTIDPTIKQTVLCRSYAINNRDNPGIFPFYTPDVGKSIEQDYQSLLDLFSLASVSGQIDTSVLEDQNSPSNDDELQNKLNIISSRLKRRRGNLSQCVKTLHTEYIRLSDQQHNLQTQYHCRLLGPRDFSLLHTVIGNYNLHAVQTANMIQRPMSYQAWLASTAPIVASLTGISAIEPNSFRKKKSIVSHQSSSSSLPRSQKASSVENSVKYPKEKTGARVDNHSYQKSRGSPSKQETKSDSMLNALETGQEGGIKRVPLRIGVKANNHCNNKLAPGTGGELQKISRESSNGMMTGGIMRVAGSTAGGQITVKVKRGRKKKNGDESPDHSSEGSSPIMRMHPGISAGARFTPHGLAPSDPPSSS